MGIICTIGFVLWLDSCWARGYVFAAFGALLVAAATAETGRIFSRIAPLPSRRLLTVAAVGLFLLQWAGWNFELAPDPWLSGMAFLCVAATVLLACSAVRGETDSALQRTGSALAVLVYVPLLFGFLTVIRAQRNWGVPALLMVLAVCKTGDMVGYFVGTYLGKRKLLPAVSPAKTVEGAVGAIVGSVAVACLLSLLGPWGIMKWNWAAVYGLFAGVIAILGDLAASVLKRQAGVKDSGNLLPGFGGMLDMIDDVLFVAPASYLFLYWLAEMPGW